MVVQLLFPQPPPQAHRVPRVPRGAKGRRRRQRGAHLHTCQRRAARSAWAPLRAPRHPCHARAPAGACVAERGAAHACRPPPAGPPNLIAPSPLVLAARSRGARRRRARSTTSTTRTARTAAVGAATPPLTSLRWTCDAAAWRASGPRRRLRRRMGGGRVRFAGAAAVAAAAAVAIARPCLMPAAAPAPRLATLAQRTSVPPPSRPPVPAARPAVSRMC